MTAKTLTELILERMTAKRAEDAAAEARKAIDLQIAALLPKPSDKSTATEKFPDLSLKCSVTYGENVTVDTDKLRADLEQLPVAIVAAFAWKPQVDSKGWALLTDDQKVVAAKYVTRKPAAPSVKLEVV